MFNLPHANITMSDAPSNVVLLTIDCLRYDRCGFNGHHRNTTPFLDELAQESIVFDNAIAPGPDTSESFPGILAGRLSADSAYMGAPTRKAIPNGTPTLASHLAEQGYATAATITNPQLTRNRNFDRGFQQFANLRVEGEEGSGDEQTHERESSNELLRSLSVGEKLYRFRDWLRSRDSFSWWSVPPLVALRQYQYRTDWPTVSADEVLDRAYSVFDNLSEPFFHWIHLMDLHGPLHPDTVQAGGLCTAGPTKQFAWDARRMADVEEPRCNLRYDSALRYVDKKVEEIVSKLKDQGDWEDTLFIFTGDHGEALYDRGRYGHPHHYLYDDLLHVPLLVHAPGDHSSGRRIKEPFSLAWLHSLIVDFEDFPDGGFPEEAEHDPLDPGSSVIATSDAIGPNGHSVAIRNQSQKYIRHSSNPSKLDGAGKIEEFYHIDLDQGERLQNGEIPDKEEFRQTATELFERTELHDIDREISNDVEDRLMELGYRQ